MSWPKGKPTWNKGKIEWKKCKVCGKKIRKWRVYCSKECVSIGRSGENRCGFKKGHIPWNKDMKRSEEFKKACRERALRLKQKPPKYNKRGKNHWNWKGGLPVCVECGKIISRYRTRCLKCHLGTKRMTTLEKKVQNVINKYKLPYKFVGNGEFFIERKNPDFININGEKKAIEVYWKRHKDKFKKGGFVGWKKERETVFSKYGWTIIFLDENNMIEEKILEALRKG